MDSSLLLTLIPQTQGGGAAREYLLRDDDTYSSFTPGLDHHIFIMHRLAVMINALLWLLLHEHRGESRLISSTNLEFISKGPVALTFHYYLISTSLFNYVLSVEVQNRLEHMLLRASLEHRPQQALL